MQKENVGQKISAVVSLQESIQYYSTWHYHWNIMRITVILVESIMTLLYASFTVF